MKDFSFISNPWFQFMILPILTTLISIGVKIVARKTQGKINAGKEDLFFGLELATIACLILAFEIIKKYQILSSNDFSENNVKILLHTFTLTILTLGGLGIILFGISFIIGFYGWKPKTDGSSTEFSLKDNTIILTDVLGLAYLMLVTLIISSR